MNAEFLFYLFLDKNNCDALVGDLEERYNLIHKKFGKRRADFWYWTQAISSVGPIAAVWAKKKLMKPGLAIIVWMAGKGLLQDSSLLSGLADLLKKVRF